MNTQVSLGSFLKIGTCSRILANEERSPTTSDMAQEICRPVKERLVLHKRELLPHFCILRNLELKCPSISGDCYPIGKGIALMVADFHIYPQVDRGPAQGVHITSASLNAAVVRGRAGSQPR